MTKIRSTKSSRIDDRRGQAPRAGGAGGLPGGLPGGMGGLAKGGGGVMALIVIAAVFILPRLLGGESDGAAPALAPAAGDASASGASCSTDLEQQLCGAVEDVSEYWIVQMPESFGRDYVEAPTVFFSQRTSTGCGQASADTGPFYCPADGNVYFDLDFLVALQDRFGATGDLAAQYIVAHEYGHHVQNVTGINAQVRRAEQADPSRANQYSVALELQADCFAGAWARSAADRDLLDNPGEIDEAINAAEAVGDDRIQQTTQGRVDPESWTHGSSAQRAEWFQRGFQTGDPTRCTTFDEVL